MQDSIIGTQHNAQFYQHKGRVPLIQEDNTKDRDTINDTHWVPKQLRGCMAATLMCPLQNLVVPAVTLDTLSRTMVNGGPFYLMPLLQLLGLLQTLHLLL